MDRSTTNVLLNTFPGLGLPQTLCIPVSISLSTHDLVSLIDRLLPCRQGHRFHLTTTHNQHIHPSKCTTVADLAYAQSCAISSSSSSSCPDILPLRLTVPLIGGKGGFGSQLRAAGGRMSSRKKQQNAELATGSARNLDGRRLRTIKEAKNLATYLATKPEMDRKQKEEQRKRWEQIIELAEQREADMRSGKGLDGRRKGLSEEWIEEKEEVADNVKNAVKIAMAAASGAEAQKDDHSDHSASESADEDSEPDEMMELDEDDMARLTREAEAGDADARWVLQNRLKIPKAMLPRVKQVQRKFAGFDDDDLSSTTEDEDGIVSDDKGKGKTKKDD